MAEAAASNVLLEAVAQTPHTHPKTLGIGQGIHLYHLLMCDPCCFLVDKEL